MKLNIVQKIVRNSKNILEFLKRFVTSFKFTKNFSLRNDDFT